MFFTAFAFLNMVIGIVVGVMDEEHTKERNEGQPSMLDLQKQIIQLGQQIEQLSKK
ncbi:MAG: voltage-gated sodium channel [Glaciecola sp.]